MSGKREGAGGGASLNQAGEGGGKVGRVGAVVVVRHCRQPGEGSADVVE